MYFCVGWLLFCVVASVKSERDISDTCVFTLTYDPHHVSSNSGCRYDSSAIVNTLDRLEKIQTQILLKLVDMEQQNMEVQTKLANIQSNEYTVQSRVAELRGELVMLRSTLQNSNPLQSLSAFNQPSVSQLTPTYSQCPLSEGYTTLTSGYCVRAVIRKLNWTEAYDFCRGVGAQLLSIASAAKQAMIADFGRTTLEKICNNKAGYWIRVRRIRGRWIDPMTNLEQLYTDWAGAPDPRIENSCVYISYRSNYKMDSIDCGQRGDFICEKTVPLS